MTTQVLNVPRICAAMTIKEEEEDGEGQDGSFTPSIDELGQQLWVHRPVMVPRVAATTAGARRGSFAFPEAAGDSAVAESAALTLLATKADSSIPDCGGIDGDGGDGVKVEGTGVFQLPIEYSSVVAGSEHQEALSLGLIDVGQNNASSFGPYKRDNLRYDTYPVILFIFCLDGC